MNTISWQGADDAAADGDQPARRVRADVRRRRHGRGAAASACGRAAASSIRCRSRRRSCSSGLGARDQSRLSEYLDNVREIERRIVRSEQQTGADLKVPEAPIGAPDVFEEHVGLMFDLMAVAFQADITRVFTFMMARDLQQRDLPAGRRRRAAPRLSHHQNKADKIARFAKVNTYHVDLFAASSKKLKDTPDGDGSLLDHSLVLYGSGMGNANVHSHVAAAVSGRRHRQRRHQGRSPHQGARARPDRKPAAQHRGQVRDRTARASDTARDGWSCEFRIQNSEFRNCSRNRIGGSAELHSLPSPLLLSLPASPARRTRASCRRRGAATRRRCGR